MIVTLIRIDAQDASGGAVPVFLASHDRPEACHLGGDQWDPALADLPSFALDFFGGAFAGQVTAPRTSFAVATIGLAAFGTTPATRARFADARVRIWIGDITSAATVDLGPLTLRFDGRIAAEPEVDESARIARFEAVVQDSWADKPLLALFAGTGGIEGPAELTGQPKPLVLGNARFCGGVLIDTVDNVWMVSNGPVQAINAAYDRLASLGTSAGNFADLAALKAASIPNGSWGTCLAQGLVRLGAPPDGRVSFDVSGSNSGTGGYVRRPGAIMRRIADLAGGTVNAASLTALDTARPYNLQLQLREQVTAREIIGQIADSVAAVAGVSLRGELFAQALAIGGSGEALNADDSSALRVAAVEELTKAAPFWRLATEAELTFELHSAEEAAFSYRWQGEYSATRVYRLDDVVSSDDGASWAYINATPAAGQMLPVWPTTSNSHWQNFSPPVDPAAIGLEAGATRNVARGTYDAGTAYVRGDIVLFSGSSYQLIVASSTGNAPPDVARWALLANAGSGPAGADGLPGLTVIVSNEAHVVATAADGSGGDYSAAGGQMRLLRGDTVLAATFSIPARTPTSPTWITIDSSGNYTVTDPGVDLATATIRATWAGVNYDRTYTLAKSKQGVTGPRLALVADNQAFTFTDGAANPASQTITLTALLNNLTGTATWSTTPAVTLGGTGNTRTLSIANFGANRQVTIEATLGGITDRITIVRLERSRVSPTGAALNTGHATDSLALWYVNGVETTPLTAPSANASFSLQTPGDVPVGLSSILATETAPGIRNILSSRIPLDPTKTYKLSAWVRTTGDRVLRLTCAFQDAAGANITPAGAGLTGWSFGTFAYWGFAGAGHPAGVWRYYEITMGPLGAATTPANGRTFAVGFTYGDGGTTPTDLEFAGYRVEELTAIDAGGPLLVGTLPPGRVEGDFGGNFIADPIFGEGWVYSNAAYSPGLSGGNLYDRHRAVFLGEGVIWFVGSDFPELERAAVTVGETYYFSGWFFRAASATGHVTARVELYDATGTNVGVVDIPGTSTVGMATNAWTRLQGQWTCPAGVAYVRPLVGNNTGGNGSTIFVGLPYFGRHQPGADVTATAQRTIEPQFPVIEIKQGEAGHTGNRIVTHQALRSTTALSGGTWSLPIVNLGAGSASINPSTGAVTLSGIVQSGAYAIRYTHTDGLPTDQAVNVTYAPNPVGGFASARTGRAVSSNGTDNDTNWHTIVSITLNDVPTGRVKFDGGDLLTGLSYLQVVSATETGDYEARLQLDGVTLTSVTSQRVVTGGVLEFTEWSQLFAGSYPITIGNRTFTVQLRRTSGTGRILATNTALEPTIVTT